jgi:hypothetical protein
MLGRLSWHRLSYPAIWTWTASKCSRSLSLSHGSTISKRTLHNTRSFCHSQQLCQDPNLLENLQFTPGKDVVQTAPKHLISALDYRSWKVPLRSELLIDSTTDFSQQHPPLHATYSNRPPPQPQT